MREVDLGEVNMCKATPTVSAADFAFFEFNLVWQGSLLQQLNKDQRNQTTYSNFEASRIHPLVLLVGISTGQLERTSQGSTQHDSETKYPAQILAKLRPP